MNSTELTCVIHCDKVMKNIIKGIYAADEIPMRVESYPFGFIANTDVRGQPGTHWVAFYVPSEEKGYFFDSYADEPGYFSDRFDIFFSKNNLELTYNRRRLQSLNSNVCGQYCCFYLLHACRDVRSTRIFSNFSDNFELNDAYVNDYIVATFSNCFQHSVSYAQSCCFGKQFL